MKKLLTILFTLLLCINSCITVHIAADDEGVIEQAEVIPDEQKETENEEIVLNAPEQVATSQLLDPTIEINQAVKDSVLKIGGKEYKQSLCNSQEQSGYNEYNYPLNDYSPEEFAFFADHYADSTIVFTLEDDTQIECKVGQIGEGFYFNKEYGVELQHKNDNEEIILREFFLVYEEPVESLIKDALLIVNGDREYNMSRRAIGDENHYDIVWTVEWYLNGDEKMNYLSNLLYSQSMYSQSSLVIKYKLQEDDSFREYVIKEAGKDSNVLKVENRNTIHGHIAGYPAGINESGFFCISQNGNSIEAKSLVSAYIEKQSNLSTYNYVKDDSLSNEYDSVYMISTNVSRDDINNSDLMNFVFKGLDDEEFTLTYDFSQESNLMVNSKEYRGIEFYYTKNNNPNHRFVFINGEATNEWEQEILKNSLVKVLGEVDDKNNIKDTDFSVWYDESQETYGWEFYCDPIVFYTQDVYAKAISFTSNSNDELLTFNQETNVDEEKLLQTPRSTAGDQTFDAVDIELRKWHEGLFTIIAKDQSGTEISRQRHRFMLNCSTDSIIQYTLLNSIGNVRNWWINDIADGLNSGSQIFKTVNASIEPNVNTNDVIDTIKSLNSDTEYQANNPEFSYDEKWFSIQFKEDTTILSKSYGIAGPNYNDMPYIKYKVSRSGINETIYVYIQNNNEIMGESVLIDDTYFVKNTVFYMGREFTVYMPEPRYMSFEAKKAIEYTGYQYPVLIANVHGHYVYGGNEDNEVLFYEDGYNYVEDQSYCFEFYNPGNEKIEDGCSLENFERINSANDYLVFDTTFGEFHDAQEAERDLLNWFTNNKIAYRDDKGNLQRVAKIFDDYNDFISYYGNDPCALFSTKRTGDKFYTSLSLKFKDFTTYILARTDNFTNSYKGSGHNVKLTDFCSDGSDADKLEAAFDELKNYKMSKLVIDKDIVLDRDVLLNHTYIDGGTNDEPFDIIIDLYGHSINANDHQIIIGGHSNVDIINSSSTTSNIYGTGDVLIDNYGTLKMGTIHYGNGDPINSNGTIQFNNENGIVIKGHSGSYIEIRDNITLTGKTGIHIEEKEDAIKYAKYIVSTFVQIESATINAIAYGVYFDCPTISQYNRLQLYIDGRCYWDDDKEVIDSSVINSKNVGMYLNGDISTSIYITQIEAATPFVMSGGKTILENYVNIKATGDYDSSKGYSVDQPNGAIFLVDSKDTSPTMRISIETNNESRIVGKGLLVAETNPSISKLAKFETYSNNQTSNNSVYIDAGNSNEGLFRGINEDAVSIKSGNYCVDVIAKGYTPSGYTYFSTQITTADGKTLNYCLKSPETYKNVSTAKELKEALESPDIAFINVNGDINYNNPQDNELSSNIINAQYNARKQIQLNGKTISNFIIVIDSDDFGENSSKGLTFYGGTVEGADTVIDLVKGKVFLQDATLKATGEYPTIILRNGQLQTDWGTNTIEGPIAIKVDVNDKVEGHYANLQLNRNLSVVGNNGPAILIEHTGATNDGNSELNSWSDNEEIVNIKSLIGSAIVIKDRFNLYLNKANINGTEYGVEFDGDFAKQEDSARVVAWESSNICGDVAAIKLIKNTSFESQSAVLTGGNNCIECIDGSNVRISAGKFKVINENGSIIHFANDETTYRNRIYVTGGEYSKELSDRELGANNDQSRTYLCMQINPSSDPYPYEVVVKYAEKKSYQNVTITRRIVHIDADALDNAVTQSERNAIKAETGEDVNIIMSVKTETSQESIKAFPEDSDCKEFYNIHIDKNYGIVQERLYEVAEYQLVSISVAGDGEPSSEEMYSNPDNIKVIHKHGSIVQDLKKVSAEDGMKKQEECYYLSTDENGVTYINIVTRRFSTFAFADEKEEVPITKSKASVELIISGKQAYIAGEVDEATAIYELNGTQSISRDDVDIVYEGVNEGNTYYSNLFPVEPGNYKGVWTIKETVEDICGSGEILFDVIAPHVHEFNKEVAEDKYLKSKATHTSKAVYYKSCECGEKGEETFEYGDVIPHTFDKELAEDKYLKSKATHTSKAVYYKSCECGEKGEETFEYGEVIPHTFDQCVHDERYLASLATCTEKAKYYKSCECGEKGEETFEYGDKLGHQIVKVDTMIVGDSVISEHYACLRCNNVFKDQEAQIITTIENLTKSISDINNSISNIDVNNVAKEDALSKAKEISETYGKNELAAIIEKEMNEDGNSVIVEKLAALEEKAELETTVTTNLTTLSDVKIVGASLNNNGSNVELVVKDINESLVSSFVDSKFDENKIVAFSMELNGVADSSNLAVPVVITIKVPESLDTNRVVILHIHDETVSEIKPTIVTKEDSKYATFVLTSFSNFAFVEYDQIITPPHRPGNDYLVPNTGIK